MYVEASSSSCSEYFQYDYPIHKGKTEYCVTLMQSYQNGNYLHITTNMQLICLVAHTAESFLHDFI